MADEFELIQSLSVLELKSSDLLVIKTTERHLTQEAFTAIADHVRRAVGHEKLLVLEAGMDIGAIRSASDVEPTATQLLAARDKGAGSRCISHARENPYSFATQPLLHAAWDEGWEREDARAGTAAA